MNAPDQANLLAGRALAHASAYLDGRADAAELARHARSLQLELLGAPCDDARAKTILDAARLLVVAMMGASWAKGETRLDRWRQVMAALVELVRHESLALAATASSPARPEHFVAPEDVAREWRT